MFVFEPQTQTHTHRQTHTHTHTHTDTHTEAARPTSPSLCPRPAEGGDVAPHRICRRGVHELSQWQRGVVVIAPGDVIRR